jgi:plastocyanin
MATVSIKLSVINNKIQIDPDSCKVNSGDQISFYTNDDNRNFEVALHNPDGFFSNIDRVFSGEVVDSAALVIGIDDPDDDHNVKYYSVCVLDVDPQPLPPDAPPRIIVHA